MSQKYGVTFWGKYFLDALNNVYYFSNRISRGKTYANTGRVTQVVLNGTKVLAKVKGHYRDEYDVELEFSQFDQKTKKEIINIIEKDVVILGDILNGQLPIILLEKLNSTGISLFPKDWKNLKRTCDCPDWGDPCKHMAAVYLILSSQIDKDPFLLFKLRGLDLVAHFQLEALSNPEYPIKISYAHEDKKEFLSEIDLIKLDSFSDFILSRLGEKPIFMNADFKKLLDKFYKTSRKLYPSILLSSEIDGIDKVENIFKIANIEFRANRDFKSSYFTISHNLLDNNKLKHLLKDFGEYTDKTVFKISPLNLLKIFLNFSSSQGSLIYTYLYFLSRVAYLVIESAAFLPAVLESSNAFSCIFKPLLSPLSVQKQIEQLNHMTPLFVKFQNDQNYFSEDTTNRFLLSCILTEYVNILDFDSQVGTADRFSQDVFKAIFKSEPIKIDHFEKKGLLKAIANYFAIFDLFESEIKFTIHIAKNQDFYTLGITADNTNLCDIKDRQKLISISKLLVKFKDQLSQIEALFSQKAIALSQEKLEEFILFNKNFIVDMGINVVLPKQLQKLLKPALKISAKLKTRSFRSFLDLDQLLEYDFNIAIGEISVTKKEIEELISQGKRLVNFRDNFVVLNPQEIRNLFKEIDKRKKLTKYDLLQLKFADEIDIDEQLKDYLNDLFATKEFELPYIKANLRTYQMQGFNWALNNLLNGFGVILADDMGLGKTIQTIAIIKYLQENSLVKNTLVVAPATLLNNWENEILKFAPDLVYSFYYGQKRILAQSGIVLTTYQTMRRDVEFLKQKSWDAIVIDEAQNIKNYESITAKSVKSIKSTYKIALSGTPVENNLSELWSIFDFAIPKYLKTLKEFQNSFAKPIEIERNKQTIERLKKITSPFMIRRLKTDKKIINDLPEKVVIDQIITMQKQQATMYKALVDKSLKEIHSSDKTTRSGLIFKLITGLKQICNHPRNYDKSSPILSDLSGKTKTLIDILDSIIVSNEKCLIFTQYVEMGTILKAIITDELSIDPLFLEGSQNTVKRKEIIETFDRDVNAKILILSLKVGGTGLNLTQANNVIHYDLWFNPAVENQATDRAFRIGQEKNVNVYRFITKNTFEEKIDKMIKSKQELSDLTVQSQESWIGKLTDEELRYIFHSQL